MQGNQEMKRANWNWVGWLGEALFDAAFCFLYAAWFAASRRREIRRAIAEGALALGNAFTPNIRGDRFEPAAALRLVLVLALVFSPVFPTTASASDIRAKLNSTDGSTSFQVRDSNETVVGSVDSLGNLVVVGSASVVNALTVSSDTYVSGNIGVGTTGNNTRLHIWGPTDQLMISDSDGAADANKWLVKSDAGALSILTADDAFGSFASAMQINRSGVSVSNVLFPNGPVGIGTDNPSGYFQVGPGTLTVLQDGNVGIGTTAPGSRLFILGDAGADNGIQVSMGAVANLRLARTDSPAQIFILRTDGDSKFKIIDETAGGAPKRLTIDTLGNIGLGTEEPLARIHGHSDTGATGPQMIVSTGTTRLFEVNGESVAIGVPLYFPDGSVQYTAASGGSSQWTTSGANIYNANAGNVGVGTTGDVSSKLDVFNGSVTIRGAGMGLAVGATNFLVTESGFVGIGTENPNFSLEVVSVSTASIHGVTSDGTTAISAGVFGENTAGGNGSGVYGKAVYGVYGEGSTAGVFGLGGSYGVYGSNASGPAVYGNGSTGVQGVGTTYNFYASNPAAVSAFLGNVGLGTTQVSSQLDVFGGSITVRGSNAALVIGTSQFVTLPVSGVTGIGTNSPLGRLMTFSVGGTGGPQLIISTGTTRLFEVNGASIALKVPLTFPDGTTQYTAAGGSQWTTSGNDIYNSNTGNVGVGTNAPSSKFNVVNGSVSIRGTNMGLAVGTTNFLVTGTGLAGIGTLTPAYPFDVWGNLRTTDASYLATTQGNVGIGSLVASSKLDVFGGSVTIRGVSSGLTIGTSQFVNLAGSPVTGVGTDTPIGRFMTYAVGGTGGPELIIATGTTRLFEVNGASITFKVPLVFPDGTTQYSSGASYWTPTGNDIYNNNSANVGVGTTGAASSKLDVFNGSVTIRGTNKGLVIGTTYFLVNGTGGAGIGTLAPAYPLDIWGSLRTTDASYLATAQGNVGVGTALASSKFDVFNGSITVRGTNSGLAVGTTNFHVASAGNVGVGTSRGSSKFDIKDGSATIRGDISGLIIGTTKFALVPDTGYTGVGTAMPGGRVHTFTDSSAGGNTGVGIQLLVATGTSIEQTRLFEVTGTSITLGLPLYFPDGSVQYVAASGSGGSKWTDLGAGVIYNTDLGNVGVGTNNPQYSLDVTADSSVAFYSNLAGGTDSVELLLQNYDGFSDRASNASILGVATPDPIPSYPNSKGAIVFKTNDGSSLVERMRINTLGQTGIGTNEPGGVLHTYGDSSGNAGIGIQLLVSTGSFGSMTRLFEVTGSSITLGLPLYFPDGTTMYSAASGSGGQWTTSGNNIYNSNSGYVGVGTNGPRTKFDVNGGSISVRGTASGLVVYDGDIRLSTTSSGTKGIYFTDGSYLTSASSGGSISSLSNAVDAIITGDSDANGTGKVILKIGSSDRVTVANSGNFGIGTSTPSSKVDVSAGSVTFRGADSGLIVGTTKFALVPGSGFLGVGTAMPGGRLHTFSDSSAGGNTGVGIQLLVSTGTSSQQTRLFEVTGTSITLGLPLYFPDGTIQYTAGGGGGGEWTANGNDIYNNNYSIGNVGIGTQTPTQTLDVLGSSVAFFNTAGGGNGTTALLLQAYDGMSGRQDFASVMGVGMQDYSGMPSLPNTKGGLIFRTSNGSLYDRMLIDYVGNVGIATNQPAALLHTFTNSGNTGVGVQLLVSTGAAGSRTDLFEVTGASITLGAPGPVVVPNANLGVGTNDPSSRFDVLNGSVSIRGTNAGLVVGANRLLVNSAGSVGIGTGVPLARMHVSSGAGAQSFIMLVSSGTTNLMEVNGSSFVVRVDAFKPGGGSWSSLSDFRLKKNIHTLDGALEKMLRLRGVNYEWRNVGDGKLPGVQTGMIAQEVEKVFPEWVAVDSAGYKYITFRGFEAVAAEAIKELKDAVDRKQHEIEMLIQKHDEQLAEQKREIEELKAILKRRQ